MAQSASPSSSPSRPPRIPKSIRRQRGLVYQGFRRLRNKYGYHGTWSPTQPIVSIDTDPQAWNAALTRLQSTLLPVLRRLLTPLPRLLDSSELRSDNGTRLALIAEIQSALDQSLDQITFFASGIRRRPLFSPAATDDGHSNEIKAFRCQGLLFKIKFLIHEVGLIFDFCSSIIQKLKHSPEPGSREERKISNNRSLLIERTGIASGSIDAMIEWLAGHEFSNIQEEWALELSGIDDQLAKLIELINLPPNREDDDDADEDNDDRSEPEARSENVVQLARSAIPTIKLARLFFYKLARSALRRTPPESFTGMSSHQLHTLTESPGFIHCDLSDLLTVLEKADRRDETATVKLLTRIIDKVVHLFDSNMLLVILYVLPLLPGHIDDPSSAKSRLQTWLITWHRLFLSATQNSIRAAQSFATRQLPEDDAQGPESLLRMASLVL